MYWKGRNGKVYLIIDMSLDYLNNCKKMLERSDIRIETLTQPSDKYRHSNYTYIDKYEVEWATEYDYKSSIEYKMICMEIQRRVQGA